MEKGGQPGIESSSLMFICGLEGPKLQHRNGGRSVRSTAPHQSASRRNSNDELSLLCAVDSVGKLCTLLISRYSMIIHINDSRHAEWQRQPLELPTTRGGGPAIDGLSR